MKGQSSGNQGGNPNNPEKVSIVGKVPIEYDPKGLNDISKAIRDQTSAQQNAGNASGGVSERGVRQQQRANNISMLALGLGGISLGATLVIILLNYKAIEAANRNAAVADSAIIENRAQFELINEPTLEIRDATLRFDINGGISLAYNIWNLGPHVANGIGRTDTLIYVKNDSAAAFLNSPFANIDTTDYMHYSSEYYSSQKATIQFRKHIKYPNLFYKFLKEEVLIYYVGFYKYKNPIRNVNRRFRCVIRLFPMDQPKKGDSGIKYITLSYRYEVIQNYDLHN